MTLRQYYHLRRDDVNALLDHWTQRQAAGKVPLRFRKEAKAILQKKRASGDNDSDVEMGPCEEAEDDPNDNDDTQERGYAELQGDGGGNALTEAESPRGVGLLPKHDDSSR